MQKISPHAGLGTLVTHGEEGSHPMGAHNMPIFQTSTFNFTDTASGAHIVETQDGFYYTRLGNPNLKQFAGKIALLEGLDLLRAAQERSDAVLSLEEVAAGQVFASGMAAIAASLLAKVRAGDTVIAQEALYSNTFNILHDIAPQYGIQVRWVKEQRAEEWEAAFEEHPKAVLAYLETPANPTMTVIDIQMVAEIAHQYGAWVIVDNTFATPYCQRPLTLGADIVVHSTTKFLSGHGAIIGGALVSRHPAFVHQEVRKVLVNFGGVASPFDAWLGCQGMKTFELRMQRHCENALGAARYLEAHPKVKTVYYPGLESHPGYAVAGKQMHSSGAMMSFELKGGYQAGETLMNNVQVATLAVSLGNVDTLIQHPASMTHHSVPREERLKTGITDGLVRFSVGIENLEDILEDLEQGLAKIGEI